MEHSAASLSLIFQATLLLLLSSSALEFTFTADLLANETDKLALVDFKFRLTYDPFGVMASWNESSHFCNWVGVTRDSKDQRVSSLHLNHRILVGTISLHIGNLSFLQSLSLANNSFYGGIPSEVGRLIRLQNLNLSQNSLDGAIPSNLSQCSNLMFLQLYDNHLVQGIPFELGSLSKLVELSLYQNNLTGRIPASFGNLTSLQVLSLGINRLEGDIPDTLAHMRNMTRFLVGVNNLSGEFQPFLYNFSSLRVLSLTENNFIGNLRPDIGHVLPNLQSIFVAGNNLTGSIPVSLSNATHLTVIDVGCNSFTGSAPMEFGRLENLSKFDIGDNFLGGSSPGDLNFLSSLTNCSQLRWIDFSENKFGGELPASIGNLSTQMTWLTLGENHIGGSIPDGIANLVNLTSLGMESNMFTGNIPAWIGKLRALTGLSLQKNKLTGEIPSSVGQLTRLSELYLHGNHLEGSIPTSLANCQHLRILDLSRNNLSGTVPNQLFDLPSLSILFNISYNSLSGPLPPEVGKLIFLVKLDVSNNKLSGDIPSTLGSCVALETLYMQENFFQGSIPQLAGLKNIKLLDLSRNNLSGKFPKYLAGISSLRSLNLSTNDLEGEVPDDGILKNASAFEVSGNSKLCGGIPEVGLRACPEQEKQIALKVILPIVSAFLCLILIFVCTCIWWKQKSKKPLVTLYFGLFHQKVSYEELRNATGGFSLGNLIGSGSFGTLYKGVLGPDETFVAVKVLILQHRGATKSFMAECEALKSIRHRNLFKILTTCSSIDFQGNEFKALVFGFMPKGNLETWLHPEDELRKKRHLSLLQRINIAIDVASALLYLHHECQTVVIHCDLKPSNVLLDNDFTAHVSDFGLAKSLSSGKVNCFSSLGIKGTIGYAATGNAFKQPHVLLSSLVSGESSMAWEVRFLLLEMYTAMAYSLLEIFTGRRPTDGLFKDNLNLHKFAKMALPNRVTEIVDQSMLSETGETENSSDIFGSSRSKWTECLVSILKVGVACSVESPKDRMSMSEVALVLLSIREKLLRTGWSITQSRSPQSRSPDHRGT